MKRQALAIDFTSSLYLGMRHPSESLSHWVTLTTGAPAALFDPPGASRVASALAALVGCEAATLGVSTMHLFLDWFGTQAATNGTIVLWDRAVYPVAKWGIELAVGRGACAQPFAHFSPTALARELEQYSSRDWHPIVVTDGYCTGCGRAAPLEAYSRLVRGVGGTLVVDDTQALGVMGACRDHAWSGGGGSLRRAGLAPASVIWIASLAKGFGVPIAALASEGLLVEQFKRESEARMHTSPPSLAAIGAAARALELNRRNGDTLRLQLAARVRRFRAGLAAEGFSSTGGMHPVQTITPIVGVEPVTLCNALARVGVRAVPLWSPCRRGPALAFVITAAHETYQLDVAVHLLAEMVRRLRRSTTPTARKEGINVTKTTPNSHCASMAR